MHLLVSELCTLKENFSELHFSKEHLPPLTLLRMRGIQRYTGLYAVCSGARMFISSLMEALTELQLRQLRSGIGVLLCN